MRIKLLYKCYQRYRLADNHLMYPYHYILCFTHTLAVILGLYYVVFHHLTLLPHFLTLWNTHTLGLTNLVVSYSLFPCTCHHLQFSIVGQVGKPHWQCKVNGSPLKPVKERQVSVMGQSNSSYIIIKK